MEYKDFEKLYRDDPIVFHLGLELFLQNGRNMLANSTDQELRKTIAHKLSGFMTSEKIQDAVKAAKEFSGLDNMVLLSYAARCGIKLEDDPVDKPGVCPLCGGSLDYVEDNVKTALLLNWRCQICGATGKEGYRRVFDSHYCVWDRKGGLRLSERTAKME